MDCTSPGSSVHGFLQARILEGVAIPFSRRSSQPRDQILVSCTASRFFTIWATREVQTKWCVCLLVTQSCLILCHPMARSPPGSSVHRILQARILKWISMPSSRRSSWPKDWNRISYVSIYLYLPPTPTQSHINIELLQFSSVAQSCPTLCDPVNRSTPGLPVHHHLPEFTQTHVLWVCDAIQPSHPLLSPFPPASNPSQHQSLFQWVNSSHEVAKVLEFQLQHHSLQRNPKVDLLQDGLVGSPCSPRVSQESSPTPQFKSINSLALSFVDVTGDRSKVQCYKEQYCIGIWNVRSMNQGKLDVVK